MGDYLGEVAGLLREVPQDTLRAISDRLWQAHCEGKQVFTCGNGGSNATAAHFVVDLVKGIDWPPGQRGFRAFSLADSTSALTAYANDLGYEHIFSEPLRHLIGVGDVLLVLSGSGESKNVLRAMGVAREAAATVIALIGRDGGRARARADISLVVPVESMQQIEDVHLAVAHALYVELKARAELGGKSD